MVVNILEGSLGAGAGHVQCASDRDRLLGVAYCHNNGPVRSQNNCVILPCAGNVLLTSSKEQPHGFTAKVADFGLARNLTIMSRVETRTYGTITHMPRELLCDGILSKVGQPPAMQKVNDKVKVKNDT